MKHAPIIVGLTGQTGAGKSTVSEIFAASGYSVIDADKVARVVAEPGTPCLKQLAETFGGGILRQDGTLDRPALAGIVFTDKAQLDRLGAVMYPYITEDVLRRIERFRREGARAVLLDAPTLFESGTDKLCDVIISVTAPEEQRLRRIMARDSISGQAARARMNAQLTEAFFLTHSDHVLCNGGSPDSLRTKVLALAEQLLADFPAAQ